jgi:hypothetical protein
MRSAKTAQAAVLRKLDTFVADGKTPLVWLETHTCGVITIPIKDSGKLSLLVSKLQYHGLYLYRFDTELEHGLFIIFREPEQRDVGLLASKLYDVASSMNLKGFCVCPKNVHCDVFPYQDQVGALDLKSLILPPIGSKAKRFAARDAERNWKTYNVVVQS